MKGESKGDYISDIHHALRTRRRRLAVKLLHQLPQESMTTRELAREIAAVDQDVPIEQAAGEPHRNVYNALSQTHLPTLSDANIIIYDRDRQQVYDGPELDIAALLVAVSEPMVNTLRSEESDSA